MHVGGKGVFATPAMIGLMEGASHKVVEELLAEGQTTVGYEVHVRHLAPAGGPRQQAGVRGRVPARRSGHRLGHPQASHRSGQFLKMADDLDRVSPQESAHVKARDKKVRGPKVVSVNPGLRKLAQHLAEKRTRKKPRKS